jgi:undecaprenyl-diphosphatase
VIGTIPGVILGIFLEKTMDTLFRNTHLVAYALIAGSVLMVFAERFSRHTRQRGIEKITLGKGFAIGLFQTLALIPGVSRSGATISGGLILGLTREAAARFSFILSIPIIVGAGAKKFLDLSQGGMLAGLGWPLLFGTAIAFISGLLVIHWLMRFLRTQTLYSFAIYRVVVALVILFFLPPL